MTTFLAQVNPAGFLYVPAGTVLPEPCGQREFDDRFWLGFSPETVAEFSDERVVQALGVARRLRASADALEARALARLD
ncbi:MAG: hypothetical protein ACRDSE_05925, partial [Pseudonocardiaceae bacterium]